MTRGRKEEIFSVLCRNIGLSTGCSKKKSLITSLVEDFKKNHENAKCIDFQLHNLEFSQKAILDFHVTTVTDIFMKEVIGSNLRRAI